MEYSEKLEGLLKLPADYEIDRDRLAQIAGNLDSARKDDPKFLEMLGHELESLGYRYSRQFATWVKRSKESGIMRFLSSIWR